MLPRKKKEVKLWGNFKKVLAVAVAVATVLCAFSAVPPFVYAEPTETVELNVGSENCTNDYYRIMDGYVDQRQRNVQYVLTGTTAKGIRILGCKYRRDKCTALYQT